MILDNVRNKYEIKKRNVSGAHEYSAAGQVDN